MVLGKRNGFWQKMKTLIIDHPCLSLSTQFRLQRILEREIYGAREVMSYSIHSLSVVRYILLVIHQLVSSEWLVAHHDSDGDGGMISAAVYGC